MSYSHVAGTGFDATAMLADPQGRGQCTAWADLLVKVLGAQGINAQRVDITAAQPCDGFQVNQMPAQGSGGAPYLVTRFGFQEFVFIANFPTRIYDPSYGTVTDGSTLAVAESQYEANNVASLITIDQNGDPLLVVDPGHKLVFTPR